MEWWLNNVLWFQGSNSNPSLTLPNGNLFRDKRKIGNCLFDQKFQESIEFVHSCLKLNKGKQKKFRVFDISARLTTKSLKPNWFEMSWPFLTWPMPTCPDLFCPVQICPYQSWPVQTFLTWPIPTCPYLSWPILFLTKLHKANHEFVCLFIYLWISTSLSCLRN